MRILWVGGGTGGHLTPALGLSEAMGQRGHSSLFLVNGRNVEKNYFDKKSQYVSLGFEGESLPRLFALFQACLKARSMAKAFRPDLVVALGGAGSIASLFAKMHCPLVVLEGNVTCGRAVRWMLPFADLLLTQFIETSESISKGIAVGPLGRSNSMSMSKEDACNYFGFDSSLPVLLATGGSQGSLQLNQFLFNQRLNLKERQIQVLALVGPGNNQDISRFENQGWKVFEHCQNMGAAWSAADFALCRGGASTLGEIWLHAVPSAIIPYPGHQDRQQEVNAKALSPGVSLLDLNDWRGASEDFWRLFDDDSLRKDMSNHLMETRPENGLFTAMTALEKLVSH